MVKRTVEIEVKTTGEQSVAKLDQNVKKLHNYYPYSNQKPLQKQILLHKPNQ